MKIEFYSSRERPLTLIWMFTKFSVKSVFTFWVNYYNRITYNILANKQGIVSICRKQNDEQMCFSMPSRNFYI